MVARQHDGGDAVCTVVPDGVVVVGAHLVGGGGIGDRRVDQARVEVELGQELAVHVGDVRLATLEVEGAAGRGVPAVDQVLTLTAEERGDPHLRPAVGPLALPRVLLALDPVDLLEAEEPPRDVESDSVADVADPDRGLVGPRAHRVEEELDVLGRGALRRGALARARSGHVTPPGIASARPYRGTRGTT